MSKEQINFLTYTALLNSGGGGGDPSNWSSYPSLTAVSMGGNSLNYNSNTSLSPTTLTINSNTTLTATQLTFGGSFTVASNSLALNNAVGSVSLTPNSLSISNSSNSTSPMVNVSSSFNSNMIITRGTVAFGGETYTTELGIDAGDVYLAGIRNPAGTPVIMPMNLVGEPVRMIGGGSSNRQLLLSNSLEGTSGYLWVDSLGALYWNSNLISMGAPPV